MAPDRHAIYKSPVIEEQPSDDAGPGRRRLLGVAGRDAGRASRRAGLRRAVRRLHRLLHVVAVRPHRTRRDRHARPHPGGAAVPAPPRPPRPRLLGYDERGPLPDAGRRRVLHLRAPAADLSHLRLPRASRRRASSSTSATRRYLARAGPALAVQLSDPRRSTPSTTRCGRPRRILREQGDELPADVVPTNDTQLAVLAVEIHDAFVQRDDET